MSKDTFRCSLHNQQTLQDFLQLVSASLSMILIDITGNMYFIYKFSYCWLLGGYCICQGNVYSYELIIEEWYVNSLKLNCSTLFNYQQIHNIYTYLSELLRIVYFVPIKMAFLLSMLLLIDNCNYHKNADKKSHFH
jgi:hypothetical protein